MKMKIAIVTGASSGLGREYARLLDKEGLDVIWLVARRQERLQEVAKELQTKCKIVPLDLTKMASLEKLQQLLAEGDSIKICWLVNAAGFGRIGLAEEIGYETTARLIDLNCRAAAVLTEICLPYCQKGSHIIEVASCAAFQPIPYLTAYAASKAFLLSYSRALNEELRPRAIHVTAVCPYWIRDTEFIKNARQSDAHHIFQGFPLACTQKQVAERSFRAAKHKQAICTPDIVSKLHRLLTAIVPTCILVKASNWYRMLTGAKSYAPKR